MLHFENLSPEQVRISSVIDQQIDDLTRLVNDLLDISQREVGKLEFQLELVEMNELVERIAEHQREVVMQQGITLGVRPAQELLYGYIDRGRISQVLNNMISNASRYVEHFASGRIELHIAKIEEQICISVVDNGCGIAPEHLSRIFEPFYQVAEAKAGKSGLGLALARELVLAHHGNVTVESDVGQGTHFSIWLPLMQSTPTSKEP